MTLGLVGRKCGMTRVFTNEGKGLPVTVIELKPNVVTQIKNQQNDGYTAIQLTTGSKKSSRVTKPLAGHYAKAGVEAGDGLWEFEVDEIEGFNVGQNITLEVFKEGQYVDVAGITKGKGFAGVIKRHNFATQDATHGNSLSHRAPGSIGQRQDPGRVFKGKRMAGHMGNKKRTTQNLQVIRVDVEKGLLFVKGAVPGSSGQMVIVKPAVKMRHKQ